MGKFSSGLLNYVESVNINGVNKTAFYSEFATNLEVGDKVFIINGNYDSDNFISSNNFSSGTDGYTVISIDRCRIILDIDYTGTLPFNQDSPDNYIKIYHIKNQHDFDYINNITINTYNGFQNKFEYGLSNNIVYTDSYFFGSTNIFGTYSDISYGFYQRTTNLSAISIWNIIGGSPYALLGTSSFYIKTSGIPTYSLYNNGKLLILGEDIIVGDTILKQNGIYSFNQQLNSWEFDITSYKPYISKLNFRGGQFNGNWNDGIFGTYINSNNWYGNSIWNSGIFINSNWISGIMNSKSDTITPVFSNSNTSLLSPFFNSSEILITSPITINSTTASRNINYNYPAYSRINQKTENYYAKIDDNGKPVQSTDFTNNKGNGFNYIIDSDIYEININNGNFINCNLGLTNYGVNTIDVYYGLSFSYSITSINGYFQRCDINTTLLSNSKIFDSNIINSQLINNRLSSNQIYNSVSTGTYNSDNGINILKADLWSYNISGSNRGVLKLFISDTDLLRLEDFETFYIKSMNKQFYLSSFNDENKVWLNLENKYILDYFNNFDLSSDTIIVSTKNANENIYSSYINSSFTTQWVAYSTPMASIDIDLGSAIYWYNNGTYPIYATASVLTIDNVNSLFTNTTLCISDFKSGIITDTTWESGSYINDNSSKILINGSNLGLSLIYGVTNSMNIKISNNVYNQYDTFNIGDYIWINGIDYTDPFNNVTSFFGTFKVDSITTISTWRQLYVTEVTNNILGLTYGGTFSISNFQPNYISVNRLIIKNSIIESGLFKTPLIINSTIYNSNFDTTDQNLNLLNINQLRFINTLLKDDNNQYNSGYIYKSHVLNTNWNNAISYNSLFSSQTFSNGVFNNSYWLNGLFNNGYFINSNSLTASLLSFDNIAVGYFRSWNYGQFNSGQFYNSIWIDGTFNNGRLYYSNWLGGIWNNGILGLKNSPKSTTTMGNLLNLSFGATQTYFYNGIVENAIIGGNSNVYWFQGQFNDGQFTSFGNTSESIWYKGSFNGGIFDGFAKWKDGVFNNGKFLSIYGYTSSNISHYSTTALYPGYGFSIGDTFSIYGGNDDAYGIINSISTGSGLTLLIDSVGNISGNGLVLLVGSVSSDATYSIASYSIWHGGNGYTASEIIYVPNFSGTSYATGIINVTPGGSVSSINFTNFGSGFSASATYSTLIYSGYEGPITNIIISDPGSNYIVGDSFTISGGTASGIVTSVGYLGNVTGVTLSNFGSGYTYSNIANTILYPTSVNHISSYTILYKGTSYTIGNYPTIPNSSSFGTGFTISIISTDTYILQQNCSWENGIFNGGQFGNQIFITNSTWYNGTFNGGIFNGKIWYSGIFTNGIFNGSATFSVYKNESNFVNSFTNNNYYGIWLDGFVVTETHLGDPSQRVYPVVPRYNDTKIISKNVTFQNMLWLGGTFSNSSGIINNSAWLNGTFEDGQFNNSAFNPFIDQSLSGSTNSNNFNFNFNNSCIWLNGKLNNSTFYISQWQNGIFNGGYMLGGIWLNGTWLYGTAENIYWQSGLWRNGNWFGTNYDVNSIDTDSMIITNPEAKYVIYNIANWTNETSIHILNIFTGSSVEMIVNPNMSPSGFGWTHSGLLWNWKSNYNKHYWHETSIGGSYTYNWIGETISQPNYQLTYTYSSTSTLYALNSIGTKDIFTDYSSSYTIIITGYIDYPYAPGISTTHPISPIIPHISPVGVVVNVGYTSSTTLCGIGSFTITLNYTAEDIAYWASGTNKSFSIYRTAPLNPYIEEVVILSAQVIESKINYNKNLNNTQYNIWGSSSSITLSATISLPSNIIPETPWNIPVMFGNGQFYSGIWENGVWNNGWRNDSTLTLCDLYLGGSYIRVDSVTHRIQLQFLNDSALPIFNIGDYVSVGNVVGLDINNQRIILRDKFKVVYVDTTNPYDNIVLEYILTTPINYITKDSPNHLIYLSKNVWLSGAFLSGYFSGIWNYGLFKGFPYITEMKDSHLIDGIFDGGHFISSIATASNLKYATSVTYDTGLVQNFIFKDENIGTGTSSLYLSWIDVNYQTTSQVNINTKTTIYETSPIGTYSYYQNRKNLYGSPTFDILSSNSYFKDSITTNTNNYSLGYSSTIYGNLIPNSGNFDSPASSDITNLGLNSLLNNGWTFSNLLGGITHITSNVTYDTSDILSITFSGYNGIVIDNIDISTTQNRYYQISMNLTTYTASNLVFGNIYDSTNFNHALTTNLIKTEWFYNKQQLNLFLVGTNSQISINNLSFYETDMIPFFEYATESDISQTIYPSYIAYAPYIDYTNANFNYIGNVVLSINPTEIGYTGSFYSPAIFTGYTLPLASSVETTPSLRSF
jgi:hypothetical protein